MPPSLLTPSHCRRSTQIGSALPRAYGLAAVRAVTTFNNLSTRRESTRAIAGAPQDRVSHAVIMKWINSLNIFRSWIIIWQPTVKRGVRCRYVGDSRVQGGNWAFPKWACGEGSQNKTRSRLRLQIPFWRVIGSS